MDRDPAYLLDLEHAAGLILDFTILGCLVVYI